MTDSLSAASLASEHHRAGVVLFQAGQHREAVDRLAKAAELQPQVPRYHNTLAVALQALGELDRAAACLEEAIRLRPDYAEAHNNLGNVWQTRGQLDRAAEHYLLAVRLRPEYAMARSNLGAVYRQQGRLAEAVEHLSEALRLQPNSADLECNLGACLTKLGHCDEALAHLQRAISLDPDRAASHATLAVLLQNMGNVPAAVESYRRSLEIDPLNAETHSNFLFCLSHDPRASAVETFEEHCNWQRLHAPDCQTPPYLNSPDPERRLRIGYVSADFCFHAVLRFIKPVLTHHDPQQFEIYCYSMVRTPDAATERLKKLVPHWRPIWGLEDADLVELVRADEIDLLIDLSGHTAGQRLTAFARRPAPVQATWLGYPGTTGMRSIDYRLTDVTLDPPGEPLLSSERPVRLARGVCCISPIQEAPLVSPLPARRTGYVSFGCMHRLTKLNAAVIDLWCRVLGAVPNAKLLILRDTLVGSVKADLTRQFIKRGIGPERLDLRHAYDARGHLAVFEEIDITLDTFPYAGGTISCESLWMGVPIITLCGDRPLARVGASHLVNLGLSDLVASTPDEYVLKAIDLAADLPRLELLRQDLRERMRHSLCDGAAFTRELESAFRTMWRTWCDERRLGGGVTPR